MNKEDFLSKLNLKDYNNQLEKILEEKSFSEGTKNILLNILYKIEIAYDDYSKVKVEAKLKKDFLEEILDIIKNGCNKIELVKAKANEMTKLGDKKFIVERKNKKIISFPNEKTVFYGLCYLKNKEFLIKNKYEIIKEPMEKLLNSGYIMDMEEIIRDFDGWSWNILTSEISNYIYNIIYQEIKFLVGYEFLQESINNINNIDFIENFEYSLENKFNEDLKNSITKLIYQISILENIINNNEKKETILEELTKFKIDLEKMNNKKVYLQEIANAKKIIGKEIKKIDEIINDNKLLREKFINRNKELSEDEKIFSLSEYSEILTEKRDKLMLRLKEYSTLMKPMNYVKRKTELKNKIDILEVINTNEDIKKVEEKLFIKLQIIFMQAYKEAIKKAKTKKEIMEYIFFFRYYKLLPINENEKIKDIVDLQNEIAKTEKYLITTACNLKAMNILCKNVNTNYEITSQILSLNIIDLEDMLLEFRKQNNNIILNVYDEGTIEESKEYETIEELNVKFNKKIKLFS